jgi:hypothetical protein
VAGRIKKSWREEEKGAENDQTMLANEVSGVKNTLIQKSIKRGFAMSRRLARCLLD